MSLSRLVPRKGMDVLIKAAARAERAPSRSHRRHRRRRPRPIAARSARRVHRRARPDGRARQPRRPPALLRLRRRLRDALPEPLGRARAGGLRDRVPRGRRRRGTAGRRRQRRGRRSRRSTERRGWSWIGPRRSTPSWRPSMRCCRIRRDARRMALAGRERAVAHFTYDRLAARLGAALAEWEAGRDG